MEPRIEILATKRLLGIPMEMSLADNKTSQLWQKFMPRRAEAVHRASSDYLSMQVYPADEGKIFSPTTRFEKWAAVEVLDYDDVLPSGMEAYLLQGGKYAVFTHHGPAHDFARTMVQIFGHWLPASEYQLDQREHFELLPEGYNPMDPDATEEVWVPIKPK